MYCLYKQISTFESLLIIKYFIDENTFTCIVFIFMCGGGY